MKKNMHKAGFTLIEMVITVLIFAILATISVYTYSSYELRGRRIDAISALLSISLAEERYRSTNTQYGTLAQVWNNVSSSSEGYYTLDISNISGSSYTITATAVGNQANDASNGTSCATLTLISSDGTITKSPSDCWPT